jgi:hypothetical protein
MKARSGWSGSEAKKIEAKIVNVNARNLSPRVVGRLFLAANSLCRQRRKRRMRGSEIPREIERSSSEAGSAGNTTRIHDKALLQPLV